jgi:hypothetical protein
MSDEHNHSTHSSDPIVGHGGTAYEGNDVQAGVVIWSLFIVAALAVAGFVLMFGVQKYFEARRLRKCKSTLGRIFRKCVPLRKKG